MEKITHQTPLYYSATGFGHSVAKSNNAHKLQQEKGRTTWKLHNILRWLLFSFFFFLSSLVLEIEPRGALPLTYIPFYFVFWNRISLSCPDWSWTCEASASASQVAEVTGIHCHLWLSLATHSYYVIMFLLEDKPCLSVHSLREKNHN